MRQAVKNSEHPVRDDRACETVDWVGKPGWFLLLWAAPALVLVFAVLLTDEKPKTWFWALSLLWMGSACLVNASRCGRMHCYFTGPFFLAMAILGFLHGYHLLWLGQWGWRWLGLAVGLGGAVLWYLPERRWGQYSKQYGPRS